jgi:ketosteroid isomerase-like protein
MTRILAAAIIALVLAFDVQPQTASDEAELTKLLKEFLAGASRSDAAVHNRFWAEDLIYTGSSGRRRSKAEVMRDVNSAPAPKPGDPTTTYTAEDIRIRQYGNVAVVAFRLIGTTAKNGQTQIAQFLNSGTFLKRNGTWQAVSWQATRIPHQDEDVKKTVSAAEAAFHQSIRDLDIKKLASVTDESFVWTHPTGEQVTRKQLLDALGSGQLKYSKLETDNVTVSIYGDAAVARGVSQRQRSSFPNSGGPGDATSSTTYYTLTFINKDGEWKAVAMHTSGPK